jgi:hypothetical protein
VTMPKYPAVTFEPSPLIRAATGTMDSMDPALPAVKLSLWRADAVVLFDWLMSTDLNTVPITHPAQKQALADLLSRLEFDTDTDITGSTAEEIAAAQAAVAKDMGW